MRARPNIVISSLDLGRLATFLKSLSGDALPGKSELEDERARAVIVELKNMPGTVVIMNAKVRFKMASSMEGFTLSLVYRKEMKLTGQHQGA